MSHTNVDSSKTFHIINSTIIFEDKEQNKFESPEGGINTKGKSAKDDNIEIPLQDVAKLKDDKGNIIFEGTLEEVKAKKFEMEAKEKTSKKDGIGRD